MIENVDIDNETRWIKPIAVFDARIISGHRVEIPASITNPLNIEYNDVIEVAFVGENTDYIRPTHAIVGVRNRITLLKPIADLSETKIGDIVTVGILTVYHNRTEDLVIVFDPEITPDWCDRDE